MSQLSFAERLKKLDTSISKLAVQQRQAADRPQTRNSPIRSDVLDSQRDIKRKKTSNTGLGNKNAYYFPFSMFTEFYSFNR